MWPFRRKTYPPREELDLRPDWALSQGSHDGNPLIVRVDRGVGPVVGHPELDHRLGVAVPLLAADANGFPTGEEAAQLDAIEELLIERVGGDPGGLLTLVLSTGGMREFVFYVSDPKAAHEAVLEVGGQVTSHELQHVVQRDRKWSVYRQLAGS